LARFGPAVSANCPLSDGENFHFPHNHLITAIGSQKFSCLSPWSLCCLWHHRPWHFTHSAVILVWHSRFKSYLSSRTFCIKCNDCFSSLHTSLYGWRSWFFALHSVYNSSQYSHFISVIISPPLCCWRTTFSLLSPFRLLGKHHSPPDRLEMTSFGATKYFWKMLKKICSPRLLVRRLCFCRFYVFRLVFITTVVSLSCLLYALAFWKNKDRKIDRWTDRLSRRSEPQTRT